MSDLRAASSSAELLRLARLARWQTVASATIRVAHVQQLADDAQPATGDDEARPP